ncbi:MCE family protein [Streptantibioticus rubrisoli]|uniref:MCE family protein n=1 Tax=Streptantibioticus rubrisoli TaxID=1387313 RepID=A0ABT1PD71_9ACTN|nr:MCE family protein [Streptantibioticus rubrisoli]MCQ4043296.1 MCE family protein [Streptantibioticus rubrisoli]
MIPFRERNPVVIGAIGLTVIALLIVAAFNVQELPLIGGGDTYSAAFSEAGGIKPGDDVRIAGVKVGQVDDVGLQGDHVQVRFRISGTPRFGTSTGAAIRVKTILGAKYLSLEPAGPGQLAPGSEIPLNRTVSAYDVVQAFSDLTTTTERVDTRQLATAMDTVSAAFQDSPPEVKASIKGLSELSRTVASRDAALRDLLNHANGVTGVLATRSKQFTNLVDDGNTLFAALNSRSQVIQELLRNAAALGVQLSGLVADNRAQIGPALSRLNAVVGMLKRNQSSLDQSIALLAPFARLFANTTGNGRWFDSYIQNLVAAPVAPGGRPSAQISPGGAR